MNEYYSQKFFDAKSERKKNHELAKKRIEEEVKNELKKQADYLRSHSFKLKSEKQVIDLKRYRKYKYGKPSMSPSKKVRTRYAAHIPRPDKPTQKSVSHNNNHDIGREYESTLFVSNTSGTGRHKRKEWDSKAALNLQRELRKARSFRKRNNLDGVDRGALK